MGSGLVKIVFMGSDGKEATMDGRIIQDGSIPAEPIKRLPMFSGRGTIQWSTTLTEADAMQFMALFRPRKAKNMVKRLAARAVINAALRSN